VLAIYPRDFGKTDVSLTANTPNVFSPVMTLSPQGKNIGLLAIQVMMLRLLKANGSDISDVLSFLRWDYIPIVGEREVFTNEFLYLPWAGRSITEQMSSKYHSAMRISLLRFYDPYHELTYDPANFEDAERRFKSMDFGTRCFWLTPFGQLSLSLKSPDTFDPAQAGNFLYLRGAVKYLGG